MTATEDRLRDSLRGLADTVPPSRHPRADFERRLAVRRAHRWRLPALVTAAAALVLVAAVAVPLALNRSDDVAGRRVATSAPTVQDTQADPATGIPLGSYTEDGGERTALFTVTGDEWCLGWSTSPGAVPVVPTCERLPDWSAASEPDSHVLSRTVFGADEPDSGPLPNLLLFLTSPAVTTLDVRDDAGEPVEVRRLMELGGTTFFLADFGGSAQGFGYDAKDANGAVVESAIT